jgi:hypothetical protein
LLLAICLPYLPIASYFELYPIPGGMLAGILLIAALYLISAEAMKKLVLQ